MSLGGEDMTDEVMKKRGLTKRKPLGSNVAVELWHALDELAKQKKRNKSGFLDEAIVLLLQAYKMPIPKGKEELVSHLLDNENTP